MLRIGTLSYHMYYELHKLTDVYFFPKFSKSGNYKDNVVLQ